MADQGMQIITTPPDLLQRLGARYPQQLSAVMEKAMEASLLHIQGSVPGYPRPRPNQSYIRTGTLGRTLGVSQSGGPVGAPSIRLQKKVGSVYEGEFGTNLSYAPDVIGDGTQKEIFAGRWWTLATVAKRAAAGIVRMHETAIDELAKWIDGR